MKNNSKHIKYASREEHENRKINENNNKIVLSISLLLWVLFKIAYNKVKDGHVKHSMQINKISLSFAQV